MTQTSPFCNPEQLLLALCLNDIRPEEIIEFWKNHHETLLDGFRIPLAMAEYRLDHYDTAYDILQSCAHFSSKDVNWNIIAGMCARQLPGQSEVALAHYLQACALQPDRADIYYNIGNLVKDDNPELAEEHYKKSILLDNSSATVWHNLGICLNAQGRHSESLSILQTSLKLDPHVPDAWCNLGLSYYGDEKFDIAQLAFRHTISLDPRHGASHMNLGNALMRHDYTAEEAIRHLELGASIAQSSKDSLFNLGLAYLLIGRFSPGWEYYEARFHAKDFNSSQIPTSGPRIRSLNQLIETQNHPIVLWSEQGMGDSIQFVRYLALFESLHVPYIFLTRPTLLNLFRSWTGLGDRIQLLGSTDPNTDHRPHIPLMSLPLLFNTNITTVPAQVPYLTCVTASPDHLVVPPVPGGINIGFVWASNPDNKAMYKNKSMPCDLLIHDLVNLASLGLAHINTFQFGRDTEQISPWRNPMHITEWHNKLSDYSDTAFVLRQLDLVISVDTSVAHLAGALNVPTWLLLPYNADFRWLRNRADSPWYPSMRLFRQPTHGDWHSVVSQLRDAIDELFLLDIRSLVEAQHS